MTASSIVLPTTRTAKEIGWQDYKLDCTITLIDNFHLKIYTTGSLVSGTAAISSREDIPFDHVRVYLFGVEKVMTDEDMLGIQLCTAHTFLKLTMPVSESLYPAPRIFEAGKTLMVPFNFIIPSRLPVSACNHTHESDTIQDYHTRLPPTMVSAERQDQAPFAASIEYRIKVTVFRTSAATRGFRPIKMQHDCQALTILPASIEDPPLETAGNDQGYVLTKSINLRDHLCLRKLGTVTATTKQPRSIIRSPSGRITRSSSLLVDLEFIPSLPQVTLPDVGVVAIKLVAITYYSTEPMTSLPTLERCQGNSRGRTLFRYEETMRLDATPPGNVPWAQQQFSETKGSPRHRNDTIYTSTDHPRALHLGSPGFFYTATTEIPFRFPMSTKPLLPSFHTCYISRMYMLRLQLSVGAARPVLVVPIQVTVEDSLSRLHAGLPSYEAATVTAAETQEEEEQACRNPGPRAASTGGADLQENSILPDYEYSSRFRNRERMMVLDPQYYFIF